MTVPPDLPRPEFNWEEENGNERVDFISDSQPVERPMETKVWGTGYEPRLPTTALSPIWTIAPETLASILNGTYWGQAYSRVIILDARSYEEFRAGHIVGATHASWDMLEDVIPRIFRSVDNAINTNVLVVVHCEYSHKRGPIVANAVRSYDRKIHQDCYPALTFPETYLLEGGFSKFYNMSQDDKNCCTGYYLPMPDNTRIRRSMSVRLPIMEGLPQAKTAPLRTPPAHRTSRDIFDSFMRESPSTPTRSAGTSLPDFSDLKFNGI